MKKINELLINKYDNHIMPFLWMHGENEVVIREYIEKIFESGIKSVCIESRPHKEFLEEKWWNDVAIILDTCEKLGMTVWILDDKHFPTGYAAGEISKNYPDLQKKFLDFYQLDVVGPQTNVGTLIKWTIQKRPDFMSVGTEKAITGIQENDCEGKIISVIASPKIDYEVIDERQMIDITEYLKGDMLYWDIPKGEWTIFVCFETKNGGEAATEGYLNPLVPEATDILINTVYETHYEKFGKKFGNTIEGFFSDEPRFGNTKGSNASIGRVDMPMPWKSGMEIELAKHMKIGEKELLTKLPLLIRGDSPEAHHFRFKYMDFITNLYRKNFSERIGTWCSKHDVKYIGHVIEDNNAHSRLGYGAGHFFKSMAGQDMAGIDVVLHQLLPNQKQGYFKSMTSNGWDGEFFHFALAKLGTSLGYLDSNKEGRTMCEVFGAYGWAEGTKLMKWIADHMLVRGVNYFVPHAFTMSDFPDTDCPPHFYAHGKNPQFFAFNILVEYMNKLSSLFSGGKHRADISVLYHGEAEWSGNYMPIQKVTRVLTENQFEFDIISCEHLLESICDNQIFQINDLAYKVLVVPYAQRLPENIIRKIHSLSNHGIKVFFIDGLPMDASESIIDQTELDVLLQETMHLTLDNLVHNLELLMVDQLKTDSYNENLRYFHYLQEEKSIYMLFNESMLSDLSVRFKDQKELIAYDPMRNQLQKLEQIDGLYQVDLDKGESVILIENEGTYSKLSHRLSRHIAAEYENLELKNWRISIDGVGVAKENSFPRVEEKLPLLGLGDELDNFSGTLIYETTFEMSDMKDIAWLSIENANEIVSIYLNDHFIDTQISYPYMFDLSEQLKSGINILRIEVVNNLGRYIRDFLSQYINFEPIGLIGKASIHYHSKENSKKDRK
ncbi:glycosyl hydrolase [Enterococcus sp. DIV0187]|uniref:glycosyl hydrolase n=1 Tax=Enterococcus sp. DIV0187 TaxID=2774644 RepID=UPI003F22AB77